MKDAFLPFLVPAGFCAVISGLALVAPTPTTFYCFLPMCFVFVGVAFYRVEGEITGLRAEVERLKRS